MAVSQTLTIWTAMKAMVSLFGFAPVLVMRSRGRHCVYPFYALAAAPNGSSALPP